MKNMVFGAFTAALIFTPINSRSDSTQQDLREESIEPIKNLVSPDRLLNAAFYNLVERMSEATEKTEELEHAIWEVQFNSRRFKAIYGENLWTRYSDTVIDVLKKAANEVSKFKPDEATKIEKDTKELQSLLIERGAQK